MRKGSSLKIYRALKRLVLSILKTRHLKPVGLGPVLPDSATPSNLNASNFLIGKDNMMLNPIFGMLSSRAIQNISEMLGYLSWLKS